MAVRLYKYDISFLFFANELHGYNFHEITNMTTHNSQKVLSQKRQGKWIEFQVKSEGRNGISLVIIFQQLHYKVVCIKQNKRISNPMEKRKHKLEKGVGK